MNTMLGIEDHVYLLPGSSETLEPIAKVLVKLLSNELSTTPIVGRCRPYQLLSLPNLYY